VVLDALVKDEPTLPLLDDEETSTSPEDGLSCELPPDCVPLLATVPDEEALPASPVLMAPPSGSAESTAPSNVSTPGRGVLDVHAAVKRRQQSAGGAILMSMSNSLGSAARTVEA